MWLPLKILFVFISIPTHVTMIIPYLSQLDYIFFTPCSFKKHQCGFKKHPCCFPIFCVVSKFTHVVSEFTFVVLSIWPVDCSWFLSYCAFKTEYVVLKLHMLFWNVIKKCLNDILSCRKNQLYLWSIFFLFYSMLIWNCLVWFQLCIMLFQNQTVWLRQYTISFRK